MKYKFLLFDADNTILDFDKAEQYALKNALTAYGYPYNDDILAVYDRNNLHQWKLYEQGKKTQAQVLADRFTETFYELGFLHHCTEVAHFYESDLTHHHFILNDSNVVLEKLRQSGYKLYLISNGAVNIQNARLRDSGLGEFFIKRFISEEVGFKKPDARFFEQCFAQIDGFDKQKTLVIGDSLTADILGGINAGVDTCWFNRKNEVNRSDVKPTYTITDLAQVIDLAE